MNRLIEHMDRRKRLLQCVLLALCMLLFFTYGTLLLARAFSGGGAALAWIYCGAALLGTAFVVWIFWLALRRDFRVERIFLWVMVVLSLAYLLFFPPISVPDEQAHYISAYRMSNFFSFHWGQLGNPEVLMRTDDALFYSAVSPRGTVDLQQYMLTAQHLSLFASDTQIIPQAYDTATNVPLGYLASALGIAVGRILRLGAVPVFYLGRLFNVAQYIALAYVAMRRIPYGKMVVFAISTFPMTLHLCASYSYDCMVIGVSLLFVAEVLRMIHGERVARGQLICCGVLAFILAPSKLVYTPLLFLVLLIPGEKLRSAFPWPRALKALLIAAGVAGILVSQLGNLSGYVGESAGAYVAWADEPGYDLGWVLQHPMGTVSIFVQTIARMGAYYACTMLGSSLGWFQLNLPPFLYVPFAVFFVLACLRRQGECGAYGFWRRSWIALLVVGSCGLVLASMLLSWTPLSYSVIQGVQGRYFLPILPAVFLLLRGRSITVERGVDRIIAFGSAYFNVLALGYCYLLAFQVV